MNKKIFIPILGLLMLVAIVGTAKAQIIASVKIRDSSNDLLNEQTVLIGTTAYAYGYYEDQIGNKPATAKMEVYYSMDGVSFTKKAEIFSGTVNDGETKSAGTYTMNELGFYQFRWTCEIQDGEFWCQETAQARTKIQLVIPEPATIVGLLMALSAFGLLAFKKTRSK
jgi:ketol-acid reductoisomerase